MTTIAELAVKLIADASQFTTALTQSQQQTQSWSQQVSSNMKSVGSQMSSIGRQATTFLTLPILGAGVGALKMASDLNETKNKVHVIFGDMSQDVLDWSLKSDRSMGQSQEQALTNASTMALWAKQAGLSGDAAVKFAENNVKLASDMASFFNTSPQDALEAIGSAYEGMSRPIRGYNVLLDQNAIQQQAVTMGLIGAKDPLTEQAKILAVNALIMKQTTEAQGDFARTSDQLANQQRILTAQFTNAAAQLGTQLLPYALKFVQWASEMITKFQGLTPEQQKWILIIGGIVAAVGPLLMILGTLITAIGAIIGVVGAVTAPVLIVIAVLIALGVAAYYLYQAWTHNWGGIQEKTASALAFVRNLIASGMQFINDLTSGKLGWLSQLWNNTIGGIQIMWQLFTTNIQLLLRAFTQAFHGDWYAFGQTMRMIWDNAWTAMRVSLQIAWANIKIIFSTAVANVINFFKTTDWGAVGNNIVKGIANGMVSAVVWIVKAAQSVGNAALNAIKGFLGIHSPSQVFEMQVGMQMAAGTAQGWKNGLSTLLQPSFGLLQPATVPVPSVAGLGGMGGGALSNGATSGMGSDRVVMLLEEIAEKNKIDYTKLARVVRDAVLMRAQ